jgi:Tol biopolymer transport system component
MRRWAIAAIVLGGGCYQPTVAPGIPCSASGECPRGQACNAGRCEPPGAIDAAVDVVMIDALGAWSAPKKLDSLNSMAFDTDPTITADGLDIVFSSDRSGGVGGADLYRASRASIDDAFGSPVLVNELSTLSGDNAPELTADGLTIYIRRSGVLTGQDVFRAHRMTRTSAFDTPVREDRLSSTGQDTNPAISRDGLTFSTTLEPSMTDRDLVLFERTDTAQPWGNGRTISELSTMKIDSGAAFGMDGLVIVFHTDRASPTADANDLYIAVRPDKQSPFGTPTPIAELDTSGNESDATVTADFRYIVFECDGDLCFSQR